MFFLRADILENDEYKFSYYFICAPQCPPNLPYTQSVILEKCTSKQRPSVKRNVQVSQIEKQKWLEESNGVFWVVEHP